MIEADRDVGASEKILEAVDRIRDMARDRPEEAALMLERAEYLAELAQQIKNDWAQRCRPAPASSLAATTGVEPSAMIETAWIVTPPSRS